MLYEQMLKERQKLDSTIHKLESRLNTLPPGKLVCAKNGPYCKWYQSDGKDKIYIPKRERPLAEQLAVKKYLTLQLENVKQEKNAIDFYLRHASSCQMTPEQFLKNNPEYRKLLDPFFRPLSKELADWADSPYEKNLAYPEHLIIRTARGYCVRSKSEALIDMYLYTHRIPFRYESALYLGETVIYPDFTIRHPRNGKVFYWEHFGKIDDPGYNRNTGSRIQTYISNGIYPAIQLIATFETEKEPLSLETVESLVKKYFLE